MALTLLNPPEENRTYSGAYNDRADHKQSMIDSALAWCTPTNLVVQDWMRIDAGRTIDLGGVVLQARKTRDAIPEYVTRFEVEVSSDGRSYESLGTHAGADCGGDDYVHVTFAEATRTRYVRFRPLEFSRYPSMRCGLLVLPHMSMITLISVPRPNASRGVAGQDKAAWHAALREEHHDEDDIYRVGEPLLRRAEWTADDVAHRSSIYSAPYPPAEALNPHPSHRWAAINGSFAESLPTQPTWIVFDLSAEAGHGPISKLRLINYVADAGARAIELHVADALEGPFRRVGSFAEIPRECVLDVYLDPPVVARFWRISVTQNHGNATSGFYGVDFWGVRPTHDVFSVTPAEAEAALLGLNTRASPGGGTFQVCNLRTNQILEAKVQWGEGGGGVVVRVARDAWQAGDPFVCLDGLPYSYHVSRAGYAPSNGDYVLVTKDAAQFADAHLQARHATANGTVGLPYLWRNAETGAILWHCSSYTREWGLSHNNHHRYTSGGAGALPGSMQCRRPGAGFPEQTEPAPRLELRWARCPPEATETELINVPAAQRYYSSVGAQRSSELHAHQPSGQHFHFSTGANGSALIAGVGYATTEASQCTMTLDLGRARRLIGVAVQPVCHWRAHGDSRVTQYTLETSMGDGATVPADDRFAAVEGGKQWRGSPSALPRTPMNGFAEKDVPVDTNDKEVAATAMLAAPVMARWVRVRVTHYQGHRGCPALRCAALVAWNMSAEEQASLPRLYEVRGGGLPGPQNRYTPEQVRAFDVNGVYELELVSTDQFITGREGYQQVGDQSGRPYLWRNRQNGNVLWLERDRRNEPEPYAAGHPRNEFTGVWGISCQGTATAMGGGGLLHAYTGGGEGRLPRDDLGSWRSSRPQAWWGGTDPPPKLDRGKLPLAFELDASAQHGAAVLDPLSGISFGSLYPADKDGVPAWDLSGGGGRGRDDAGTTHFLERDDGATRTVPQQYTVGMWLQWREGDVGYRTLLCGTGNYPSYPACAHGRELGVYTSRGEAGFFGCGFNIDPTAGWQLVIVTGEGQTPGGHEGTSTFYCGSATEAPARKGTAPRVACGTGYQYLGHHSPQGPGWIAQVWAWDTVLSEAEILRVHQQTCGRYARNGSATLEAELAAVQAEVASLRQLASVNLSLAALPLVRFAVPFVPASGYESALLWEHGHVLRSAHEVGALLQLWREGGRGRRLVADGDQPTLPDGYRLTRIEAIDNRRLRERFLDSLEYANQNRASGNPAFNPTHADPDGDKAAVFALLRARFFPTPALSHSDMLLALHGCDHDAADNISATGFAQINFSDNGFFGKGLYTTTHAEYACQYAAGGGTIGIPARQPNAAGEYVLVASWAAPGTCYPITRYEDYTSPHDPAAFSTFYAPPPSNGLSLKHNYQSHYAVVNSATYQVPVPGDGVVPDYDELVLQDKTQLLPAYRLYFTVEAQPVIT